MSDVYVIMSPEGGISYNIFSGKGTVYKYAKKARKALDAKNKWSKIKGYGTYTLMTLEVDDDDEG